MVMKTFFIFNRGGEILFHWSAQEENDKQLTTEQLNESKTDLKNKNLSKKSTSSAKKPKKTKKVSKK